MSILLALAVATAITPDQSTDIGCVAQLALVANRQKHGEGRGGLPDLGPDIDSDGAEYAAVVGADVMDTTGQTQEQVRDLILSAADRYQKSGKLNRAAISQCALRMHIRLSSQSPN